MIDRFELLYGSGVSKYTLSDNPNLTTEQIDLLYENKVANRVNLARKPKLTEKQFMRFFNEEGFKEYLARNPNLTPEQIDLLYDAEELNQFYLAQFPKLTDEQFMRFFNNHPKKRIFLSANPNLTSEQIDLLYESGNKKGGNVNLKRNLARYPKLSEEQFMRFFNHEDFDKDYLAHNPNLTTEQIDLLYQTEGVNKNYLAQYPKLTDEQFLRFFNDEDVRNTYLTLNPSINPPANKPFASGIFNWKW